MHALVEAFVVVLVIIVVGAALVFGLALRWLRRAVRLIPQRATSAPASWMIRPGRPAQLHRRLRRSCRLVGATVGTPTRSVLRFRRPQSRSPLHRVGAEVIEQAVVLDGRLTMVDRMTGSSRRATLHTLSAQVRSVEAAAQRLSRLDSVWREHQRSLDPAAVTEPDLELRLDAVEAAMVELQIQPPPG